MISLQACWEAKQPSAGPLGPPAAHAAHRHAYKHTGDGCKGHPLKLCQVSRWLRPTSQPAADISRGGRQLLTATLEPVHRNGAHTAEISMQSEQQRFLVRVACEQGTGAHHEPCCGCLGAAATRLPAARHNPAAAPERDKIRGVRRLDGDDRIKKSRPNSARWSGPGHRASTRPAAACVESGRAWQRAVEGKIVESTAR